MKAILCPTNEQKTALWNAVMESLEPYMNCNNHDFKTATPGVGDWISIATYCRLDDDGDTIDQQRDLYKSVLEVVAIQTSEDKFENTTDDD